MNLPIIIGITFSYRITEGKRERKIEMELFLFKLSFCILVPKVLMRNCTGSNLMHVRFSE